MIQPKKTASILVIGDEILSGRTEDQNAPFLIKQLAGNGVTVRYCVTVADNREDIQDAVRYYASRVNWLFTSGGIGPTLDDITVRAVAGAFQVPVIQHPGLAKLITEVCGKNCKPEHLKMAEVPEGALIHERCSPFFPAIQFRNIFILPGVPNFFRGVFASIKDQFQGRINPIREIDLEVEEGRIANFLQQTLDSYPEVKIGSYPCFSKENICVKIVLEHGEWGYLNHAFDFLYERVNEYIR